MKCPRCELNYIDGEIEEICSLCYLEINRHKQKIKQIETDFSKIIQGKVYGKNSKKIYEKFCETLNWDKNKINCFGWQTPLYAHKADKDRIFDIWFIFHANFGKENIESVVENGKILNIIENNGEKIIEIFENRKPETNVRNRVVFVNTSNGYEFYGVYKTYQEDKVNTHKRISKIFPLN